MEIAVPLRTYVVVSTLVREISTPSAQTSTSEFGVSVDEYATEDREDLPRASLSEAN